MTDIVGPSDAERADKMEVDVDLAIRERNKAVRDLREEREAIQAEREAYQAEREGHQKVFDDLTSRLAEAERRLAFNVEQAARLRRERNQARHKAETRYWRIVRLEKEARELGYHIYHAIHPFITGEGQKQMGKKGAPNLDRDEIAAAKQRKKEGE